MSGSSTDAGSLTSPIDHVPVMLGPSIEALGVAPGGKYLDATLGFGGHSAEILRRSAPDGRLWAVDRDAEALRIASQRLADFGPRARLGKGNYAAVRSIFPEVGEGSLDGALIDLGVSSMQLMDPARGFSLMRDGPLDMRMDVSSGETAAQYIARVSIDELEERLREAGEERFGRKLARLLKSRPEWRTTKELADALARAVPRRGKSHPGTRVFLALRMAVNRELESLKGFLREVPALLKPGGKLVVLTFHSTEDRIAKRFYKEEADLSRIMSPLLKSPKVPDREEQRVNPRSRSAKMRVFEKCEV